MSNFVELSENELNNINGGVKHWPIISVIPTIYKAIKDIYYGFTDARNGN